MPIITYVSCVRLSF